MRIPSVDVERARGSMKSGGIESGHFSNVLCHFVNARRTTAMIAASMPVKVASTLLAIQTPPIPCLMAVGQHLAAYFNNMGRNTFDRNTWCQ